MCGLAGSLGSTPLPEVALTAMAAALAHRGPDGRGSWSDPTAPGVQLLHHRLAIQDLSATGQQPMTSACGRYVLVFNGEIYNQRQLRRQLEQQGHRFRSSGDTEVLLQLLIRYGLAALQKLQGMYAFCLWDRQRREAWLARDPFGIKPLYLWHGPHGQLLFASELRALLAGGVIPRRLDLVGLRGFLSNGSLPGPLTLVQGIRSLPAGWCGLWRGGAWQAQPHWRPSYAPGLPLSEGDAIAACRTMLQASLAAHQRSDVPVGLFLSGGLDSAALLALSGGSAAITSLTVGFTEAPFDESGCAAALARHFGSRHTVLTLTAGLAAAWLPGFLAAVDQPSVDGFNTYCVSALAHQQGLKVVLSGLGGDELFGGYPSFERIPDLLRWHRRLGALRGSAARHLGECRGHQAQRLSQFLSRAADAGTAHHCLRGLFADTEISTLLQHWGLEAPAADAGVEAEQEPLETDTPTLADAISWLELSRYMGPQLLRDADVFSMAHGLELRLPLVDADLFRGLSALPAAWRLAGGKRMLRQAMPELQATLPRAAKQGFALPYRLWFDQPESPLRPGGALMPLPSLPPGLDLSPWARRWGLMVLRDWLQRHLGMELG